MTRNRALQIAEISVQGAAIRAGHKAYHASAIVSVLEDLGLLKLDEPKPATIYIPQIISYVSTRGVNEALVREDDAASALRAAGYEVTKR